MEGGLCSEDYFLVNFFIFKAVALEFAFDVLSPTIVAHSISALSSL